MSGGHAVVVVQGEDIPFFPDQSFRENRVYQDLFRIRVFYFWKDCCSNQPSDVAPRGGGDRGSQLAEPSYPDTSCCDKEQP